MVGERLVIAVVIALVTGAACVTAAGLGTVSQRGADLAVPSLWPGDTAAYLSGERFQLQSRMVNETLLVRFSEEPWFAPDGHVEPRLVLRHGIVFRGWGLKVWLDGVDVLASKVSFDSGGATGTLYAGPAGQQVMAGSYQTFETRHMDPLLPTCGLVHSLQGLEVEPGSVFRSPGCPSDLAWVSVDNGTATFEDGAGTRVVVDSATSVPTSITTAGKTWNLTAFARGRPGGSAPVGATLPIEFREGASPDTRGVDQLFPYEEALRAVLDGPAPNAVRDYVADHPGAYIAEAAFTEIQDGGNHRHVWRLVASDGFGAGAVNVSREGSELDVPLANVSRPVAMVPLPVIQDVAAPAGPYPTAPPDSFPTLATLEARWESHREEAAPRPNAWGFTALCGATCDEAELQTWYGVDLHWTLATCGEAGKGDPVYRFCDSLSPLWIRDQLTIDDEGRSVRSLTTNWRYYNEIRAGDQPLVADGIGSPPAQENHARPSSASVTWAAPSGPVAAGATLFGLLAGLLYAFWPDLRLALTGLVKDARALHNPVRAAIVSAIEDQPGTHYQELRRTLDKPGGTIRHHLRLLEHDGIIVSHMQGGYRCFFPANGARRDLVAGVLKSESARRILRGLVEAGHLSMGQAAAVAGVTASAATHHAVRMEEAGLVTRTRVGREVELRPTGRALTALEASER